MRFENGYAVIDLETTGFGGADRIIEIGIAFLTPNLDLEETWETLVQPNRDVPNSHIHKLTPTDLRDAPEWEEVAPVLAQLLNGRIGVAHNASFERRFLTKEFQRLNINNNVSGASWVDTRVLASRYLNRAKLSEALNAADITNDRPHAALSDALATAELLQALHRTWGAGFQGSPLKFAVEPGELKQPRLISRDKAQERDAWLARIAGTLPTGGNSATSRYHETLRAALADHRLERNELQQLALVAAQEGLTPTDRAEIHEDFLRQVAIEAWMDGILTDDERAELLLLGDQLIVHPDVIHELLSSPQTESEEGQIELKPGDRIALTGSMDLPRETWEGRVASYGLHTGGVCKKTVLLVAANPDSCSGKARRANELGIPIISEKHFATLLAGMQKLDAAVEQETSEGEAVELRPETVRFSWVSSALPGCHDYEFQNSEIASLWINHYPAVQLREISPLLTDDMTIDLLGSSASKAGEIWANRFKPMLTATVEDLRDLPGVGAKRLELMVEAVILAAIDADTQSIEVDDDATYIDDYVNDFADPYSIDAAEQPPIPIDEIDLLRSWVALKGLPALPDALKRAAPHAEKYFAQSAPLSALFDHCAHELSIACGGDHRKTAIVSSRYMGNATLEELGREFGITRERVRQLESQLKKDFDSSTSLSLKTAKEIAAKILPLSRYESLLQDMPELKDPAHPFAGTYEDFFLIWNLWDVEDEWVTAPKFVQTVRETLKSCADKYNVVRLHDAVSALEVDEELFLQWLPKISGVVVLPDKEHLLIANSHQDRAVGVLSLSGEPMGTEDIVDALGIQINPRSLANQLAVDERIIRVGNSLYALADWNLEEFRSISEWIANRIEASDSGSVPLDELIADAPKLNVSETSVRAYAAGSDFEVVDGMVTLSGGIAEIIQDDPRDYRDLYLRNGAWEMLLTVNQDHLRGSGFQVPRGVAGIYNVPVGGEVAVPSRLGEQFVRVNQLKQPSTSTIRRFLLELEATKGDRVWLRYAPDQFDVRPAPESVFPELIANDSEAVDLPYLLDYMALPVELASDVEKALHQINIALGLAPNVARRRTVAVFRHRGQDQFAEIVRGI